MAKANQSNHLLLAIGLAASLAAFGCTTNMNPGSGTPSRATPEMRTTPTSGEPIGTENTPPLPPPMTSSYTATPRSLHHTPDEAAAIMAGHAPLRGRYLGVTSPGGVARGYASDMNVAQLQRPPYSVPEQTVNSSIVSPPTGVVNATTSANSVVASASSPVRIVRSSTGATTVTNTGGNQ